MLISSVGGEGGIRTPDAGITDVTVFETAAFNHSATCPWQSVSTWPRPFNYTSPSTIISHNPVPSVYSNGPDHLVFRPRQHISASRGKSPAKTCILCGENGPDRYAGRLRDINHELEENPVC